MPGKVGGKLRGDDEIDVSAGGRRHVEQPPRFRTRKQLVPWVVPEGNGHDLRVVPARGERSRELAHENLGAAVHERHLRLQDQVAKRKLMISPSWTMYSLPSRRTSP